MSDAAARTGRRPGNQATRQTILTAARDAFAANGFACTTIRSIAAAAGVDPALVHHYFGSKDRLLLATIEIPVDSRAVIATLAAVPPERLGATIASTILGMWESPAGSALAAALRTALSDPAMARTFREFVVREIVNRVLRQVGCPPQEADLRAGLLVSQVLGVAVGRYLLHVQPLASQPIEDLARELGRTLQRYLTGPVGPDPA